MLIAATAAVQQPTTTTLKGKKSSNGIIQRFEVQLATAKMATGEEFVTHEGCCSTSQQLEIITDPSNDAELVVRCPCCRSPEAKLICVDCLCTNVLRIGRIKEDLRRLQQSKVAVCHLIETTLVQEVKFESDFHQIRRSVEELKAKIAWKKDQVGRLRQRIANMEGQSERNQRNVVLLEKKMVSHAERIQRTSLKIVDVRQQRGHAKIKFAERLMLIAKILLQNFRFEKRQLLDTAEHVTAWTGQNKMHRAVYLLNNCPCLDRAALLAKAFPQQCPSPSPAEQCTSSPNPAVHSQPLHQHFPHDSLAALAFAAQFTELLAHLLGFHLPYEHLHKTLLMVLPTAGGGLLQQALFRLDYACLHLCLGQGVLPEECELTEPLANLHALMQRILAGKMAQCVPRVDQRLHRQISTIQPGGRVLNEFTLDNVENDWVKVHCTN